MHDGKVVGKEDFFTSEFFMTIELEWLGKENKAHNKN